MNYGDLLLFDFSVVDVLGVGVEGVFGVMSVVIAKCLQDRVFAVQHADEQHSL